MKNPILRLAIPNILSNITVPLVGIVDLALMGHLSSELHLNAIAIGGTIFSFLYMSFGFLRMGTTGLVAQAYGRNNKSELIHIFSRALLVAFFVAAALLLLQKPIGWLSMILLDAGPEVNKLALDYFHIRIFAAPATLGLYAIMGWYIGNQDTKTPLLLALTINIGNVVFNLIFIKLFGMKSSGVAWGTLIAQYIGFIIGLLIIFYRNKKLWKLWRWEMVIVPKKLQHFFAINSHIFIRTIVLLLTLSFFTASSARMGSQTLAINTILLQFFMFFTYFIDGFANAAEALVGKYIGAFKSPQDLKKLIRTLFLWAFGLSIPFAIGYLFFGEYIIILLTDIPSIMQGAKSYFIWIGLMPLLSFAAFIWDGVFIGATKTSAMRNSMLVSSFLIFFPLYFIFQPIWGNHGLWLAFNAFLLSRGLFLHVQAKKQLFNHSN